MISNLVALEIISNPNDLLFSLSDDNYFIISRGPGHNYKMLVSGSLKGVDDPIEIIEELLISLLKIMNERLSGEDENPVFRYLNPNKKPVEDLEILQTSDVKKIVEDIRETGTAKTFDPPSESRQRDKTPREEDIY